MDVKLQMSVYVIVTLLLFLFWIHLIIQSVKLITTSIFQFSTENKKDNIKNNIKYKSLKDCKIDYAKIVLVNKRSKNKPLKLAKINQKNKIKFWCKKQKIYNKNRISKSMLISKKNYKIKNKKSNLFQILFFKGCEDAQLKNNEIYMKSLLILNVKGCNIIVRNLRGGIYNICGLKIVVLIKVINNERKYVFFIKNMQKNTKILKFINKYNLIINEPNVKVNNTKREINISIGNNILLIYLSDKNIKIRTNFSYSYITDNLVLKSNLVINKMSHATVIYSESLLKKRQENYSLNSINSYAKTKSKNELINILYKGYNYPYKKHNLQLNTKTDIFKNFKVETSDLKINKLINDYLPHKITKYFNKNNMGYNFYDYTFKSEIESLKKYSYKHITNLLLQRKEYARLYNFLLNIVLGVKCIGNILHFTNYNNYRGKIILKYYDSTLIKYNVDNGFYFLYENILYRNVNVFQLNKKIQSFLMFLLSS